MSTVWHELRQQSDIDNMLTVFGGFHDSCIKEVAITTREFVSQNLAMAFDNLPVIRLVFQRQFRTTSVIELQFEDVKEFNWVHQDLAYASAFSIIYEAVLLFEDGLIYWAEDIDWSIKSPDRNEFRWIAAKSAKWRLLDSKLGSELIYEAV